MRISDWCSDVCSSDLLGGRIHHRRTRAGIQHHRRERRDDSVGPRDARLADLDVHCGGRLSWQITLLASIARVWPASNLDRKSVVLGRSGSERLDPGGGRIIKKKIHYIETTQFTVTSLNNQNNIYLNQHYQH